MTPLSERTCTPRPLGGHVSGENDPLRSLFTLPPAIDGPLCVRGHRKVYAKRGFTHRWACTQCEKMARLSWRQQQARRARRVS
jgi:hypothetical protein